MMRATLWVVGGLLLAPLVCRADSWETAIAGVLTTPPAEGADGRIYCTAEDKALHALDGRSGREYWSFRPGRKLIAFTVVSPDGTIFILSSRRHLVAVSPGGWERWRLPLEELPAVPPAVDSHGLLYLLLPEQGVLSIDRMGGATALFQPQNPVSALYAYRDRLLLTGPSGTDIHSLTGELLGTLPLQPDRMVLTEEAAWCRTAGGEWFSLDPLSLQAEKGDSPFEDEVIYPPREVLITEDSRIVSGRNDWFMEAYRQGSDSYRSLYQPGCNPSRTNSLRSPSGPPPLPGLDPRESLGFFLFDQGTLQTLLEEWEGLSYQQLLQRHPGYARQLMDLAASALSHAAPGQEPSAPVDSYSLARIYGLLSRWGDPQTRSGLLWFASVEENRQNLQKLLVGLGRIGIDRDGRSQAAVAQILRRRPGDEELARTALQASLLIGRYNGGARMEEFLEILRFVGENARSSETDRLIRRIMKTLSAP